MICDEQWVISVIVLLSVNIKFNSMSTVAMDYSLHQPGTETYSITFLPGEMSDKCRFILILEDSHLEESETFFMSLESANPVVDLTLNMSRVTILDNDGGLSNEFIEY